MPQPQPTPAQKQWMELGYGMFIHFGPNSFAAKAWGDGKFPADQFRPTQLDCRQWAQVAVESGMKYAVLTTKHHDGFCLWPSKHTEYSVKNAPGSPDVVRQYVDAFRAAGLKVGLYYSLWDLNFPQYANDLAYNQYMRDQMTELLTGYGEILEMWFDGGWDKDHPTKTWEFDEAWDKNPDSGLGHGERWQWKELYAHIHNLQPNCLVIQNSSSDRPGIVKYHPQDVRTSEHFDFIYHEKAHHAVTDPIHTDENGVPHYLPLEFNTTVNTSWFWIEGSFDRHPSPATIADWYRRARSANGNLLLNVGPNKLGLVPDYHRPFLREAARQLGLR